MIRFFILLFFIVSLSNLRASEDLIAIRKTMEEAVKNKALANLFHTSMKKIESDIPLAIGYKAMSELVMCKHVINPISKLSHFQTGKNMLEKAISLDSENAELRFYRYCTQLNVPSILNYSTKLTKDKVFLFNFLATESKNPKKDLDLYERIKKFLITNRYATEDDKRKLISI